VNKRQRKKRAKQAMQRFSDSKGFEKLAELGASFIRDQLARPSPLHGLFAPLPRPPFRSWRDAQGVVHLMSVNAENESLLACTANPGFGELIDDTVATCVKCVAYESRRAWAR
jgi:hypothetical protein